MFRKNRYCKILMFLKQMNDFSAAIGDKIAEFFLLLAKKEERIPKEKRIFKARTKSPES